MPTVAAARANDFTSSLGVNTHLDFPGYSYSSVSTVINALNYLGVKNIRDFGFLGSSDLGPNGTFATVAAATGAKFDFAFPSGTPQTLASGISEAKSLASLGILDFLEGSNEPDGTYSASQGYSVSQAVSFQQQLYALGQQLGLPVINFSFTYNGNGNPDATFAAGGDLTAYADYSNAHTYPVGVKTGPTAAGAISELIRLSQLSARKPTIQTEFGYNTGVTGQGTGAVSYAVQAKGTLDGVLDAFQDGVVKTYIYELLDDHSSSTFTDNWGLFTSAGAPKPAATAIHNLLALLGDTSSSFAPIPLTYSLSGVISTDHTLLLQKSDGTFWLAIWNETPLSDAAGADLQIPTHTVSLSLATAANIAIFDPLIGTSVQGGGSASTQVSIAVPDHPILIEIGTPLSTGGLTAAAQAVQTAVINLLRGGDAAFAASAIAATNSAMETQAVAVASIVTDATNSTEVATLSYQFFTGRTPSQAGIDYLVSPTGANPNNLSSTYYAQFSTTNRYINFASNLGKVGEGAAAFQASYGSLSLTDATSKAYSAIFGTIPTADKVSHLLHDQVPNGLGGTYEREDYFASYGLDGLTGQGTKAAMVGWLLSQAAQADLGTYAKSDDAFLTDVATGQASFGVDLIGAYAKPGYAYGGG